MTANSEMREQLGQKLGEKELEERVLRLRQESGGLLDDEAVLALIADEEGMTQARLATLAELAPEAPVMTRARIEAIEPARKFQGRDREGRLRTLKVSDATGSLTLTLWDEEVDMVEQLGMRPGSVIRILSAVLKQTRYGPEIHVGRTGFIVPEEPPRQEGPTKECALKDLDGGRVTVRGVLLSWDVSGRGHNKVARGRLFDGTAEAKMQIIGPLLEGLSQARVGTELELSGALVETLDGTTMLGCDERTKIRIL